jgi:hypothetical protein
MDGITIRFFIALRCILVQHSAMRLNCDSIPNVWQYYLPCRCHTMATASRMHLVLNASIFGAHFCLIAASDSGPLYLCITLEQALSCHKLVCSLQILDDQSGSAAAAVADASDANLRLLVRQHRRKRRQDAGPGGTQRMANGNGSTEHVDLLRVQLE